MADILQAARQPMEDTCVAVPKTAFNAEQCAVQAGHALCFSMVRQLEMLTETCLARQFFLRSFQAGRVCSVVQATSASLVLNSSTLELISVQSGSYVYTAGPPKMQKLPTKQQWHGRCFFVEVC